MGSGGSGLGMVAAGSVGAGGAGGVLGFGVGLVVGEIYGGICRPYYQIIKV